MLSLFIWLMEFILGFLKKPSAGDKAIEAVIENKQEVIKTIVEARKNEDIITRNDKLRGDIVREFRRRD